MDKIDAADLDLSTLSTKNEPMRRYNDKLFKRGKIVRNHEGVINNCYWYCATTACKASLRYSINTVHQNLYAKHDGLDPGIENVVLAKEHSYHVCNVTPNDISKHAARTETINLAAAVNFQIFMLNREFLQACRFLMIFIS